MKNVYFIISGVGYSGAEIVLERYLNNNNEINPYFIIIYNKLEVYSRLCNIYGEDRVINLGIKHNKNKLRFIPWYDMMQIYKKMNKLIKNFNVDLIYCNNTIETMLMSLYIKHTNISTIAHIHDMKSSIRSVIRKKVTERSLRYYNEVFTVSKATKADWNEEKMKIIYNGLDENYFNNDFEDIKKIKRIGYIGSISKRKGVDYLIDEIDELIKDDLEIIIVCSTIEDIKIYNKLNEKIKIYPNKIKIFFDLDYYKILEFYDSIDLLIVPSRHDPLPTVIMECLARGTLVIGNNIDGIPEMLENKILMLDIKNGEKIRNKVNELNQKNINEINDLLRKQFYKNKTKFNNNSKILKINNIINNIT